MKPMNDLVAEAERMQPVFRPGQNCWRVSHVEKAAFLVDGDEFFRWLDAALRMARRRIFIIGWDFDPDIRLRPLDPSCPTLGELLRKQVEDNPELEVRILIWAIGPILSGRQLKLFRGPRWAAHPRISLSFDLKHPIRASHHQKIVIVDEALAFVGGMDLTAGRWDTSQHRAHWPERTKPNGRPYYPVHDVQMMMSGPAATDLSELARRRWRRGTGEDLSPLDEVRPLWVEGRRADIAQCSLAIARTQPGLIGFQSSKREAIRLTHDALMMAKRHIYIEAQYLASIAVGERLAGLLERPTGPEIVIVVTQSSRGAIEHYVLGHNRNRVVRRLKAADRYGRLRVMYAVVPDEEGNDYEVLVHSKILIADDAFARVGSSNLNNRSEGLDTECDVALWSAIDEHRAAITAFRNRLLSEHLDCSSEDLAVAIEAEGGSLVRALDRLNIRPRGLRPYSLKPRNGKPSMILGTSIIDPAEPFWPLGRWSRRLRSGAAKLFGRLLPGLLGRQVTQDVFADQEGRQPDCDRHEEVDDAEGHHRSQ